MIALSLDDCRLKVSYYTEQLAEAEREVKYLRQPDKEGEHYLLTEIRTYQMQAQHASESVARKLYLDLVEDAKETLKKLPQHMSDDELAEALARNNALVKRYRTKLTEALDEMGALQATPELFDEIRAQYNDLPHHAIGEPLFVMDNGTVLLMSGQVFTGAEIDLYRTRKAFGDVEVLDG